LSSLVHFSFLSCTLTLLSLSSSSFSDSDPPRDLHSFPTRRSSDLRPTAGLSQRSSDAEARPARARPLRGAPRPPQRFAPRVTRRSEEHTSELQSHLNLVCRLLLEKKKKNSHTHI